MKSQVVIDKATRKLICTVFDVGKRHDFRLFRESKTRIHSDIRAETDTGYQGIAKIHAKSVMPKKRSKNTPLTREEKRRNREISSQRAINEHAIGFIKRFKVVSERYRNRRRRFGLRFNLIAGICNFDM